MRSRVWPSRSIIYVRPADDLVRFLNEFIAKDLQQWTRTFPLEFYELLFMLRGESMPTDGHYPQYIGRITNEIIYERLGPGTAVLDELRELNPIQESGHRKSKHHQWLSPDVGHPELRNHIDTVITLMRIAGPGQWDHFLRLLNKGKPKINQKLPLLTDADEEE